MGLVSDSFATAREQKHVARKLKERKQAVSTERPVRRLKRLAALLPKDVRADAMASVRQGGVLPRQELMNRLATFERMKLYINYDWS
jgi:hypothetical protein